MVLPLLLGLGLLLLGTWTAGFLLANDLRIPSQSLARTHRAMAVFPHADDETITSGGSLRVLARTGAQVVLVILTSGERGTADGRPSPRLAEVRAAEARRAARLLGVTQVVQGSFPDGSLASIRDQVGAWLATEIADCNPELVITYNRAGLYGHPDHVACSEIVTDLQANRFPSLVVWHASLPGRLARTLTRVGALPPDSALAAPRARPTGKVFVGRDLVAKYRAWNAYLSQRRGLGRGAGRFVPSWLFLTVQLFEYFEQVG